MLLFYFSLYAILVTWIRQCSLNLKNGLKMFLIVRHTGYLLIRVNKKNPQGKSKTTAFRHNALIWYCSHT